MASGGVSELHLAEALVRQNKCRSQSAFVFFLMPFFFFFPPPRVSHLLAAALRYGVGAPTV